MNSADIEKQKAALKEAHKKAVVENVKFYRWGSGNADYDIAKDCLAVLEKEVETIKPSPGVTYSEHCVYVAGARSMINFLKGKIKKGEGQAHENNSK